MINDTIPQPFARRRVTFGWAVLNSKDIVLLHTVSYRKPDAIKKLIGGSTVSWRKWKRKYGLRAVRIEVTER
jgi:hypothetical protein